MSRISIEVSPEEHRKLKACAALEGKTMKDYLLDGKLSIPGNGDEQALKDLEAILDKRIEHHTQSGGGGRRSASAILQDVLQNR